MEYTYRRKIHLYAFVCNYLRTQTCVHKHVYTCLCTQRSILQYTALKHFCNRKNTNDVIKSFIIINHTNIKIWIYTRMQFLVDPRACQYIDAHMFASDILLLMPTWYTLINAPRDILLLMPHMFASDILLLMPHMFASDILLLMSHTIIIQITIQHARWPHSPQMVAVQHLWPSGQLMWRVSRWSTEVNCHGYLPGRDACDAGAKGEGKRGGWKRRIIRNVYYN